MGLCISKNNKYSNKMLIEEHPNYKYNYFTKPPDQTFYNMIKQIDFTIPIIELKEHVIFISNTLLQYNLNINSPIGKQPFFVLLLIEIFNQFRKKNQIFSAQLPFVINSLKINYVLTQQPVNPGTIYIYKKKISFLCHNYRVQKYSFNYMLVSDLLIKLSDKYHSLRIGRDFATKLLIISNKVPSIRNTDLLKTAGTKPDTTPDSKITPSSDNKKSFFYTIKNNSYLINQI